jgi:hypothetical protein
MEERIEELKAMVEELEQELAEKKKELKAFARRVYWDLEKAESLRDDAYNMY